MVLTNRSTRRLHRTGGSASVGFHASLSQGRYGTFVRNQGLFCERRPVIRVIRVSRGQDGFVCSHGFHGFSRTESILRGGALQIGISSSIQSIFIQCKSM